MKLINNSTRNYMAFNVILEAGKVLDIKDKKTAKILLKQDGVEEYIDKKEVEKLKKELKELKENKTKQTNKQTNKQTKSN